MRLRFKLDDEQGKKSQTNSNFKKRFQFSKNLRDLTGKVTKDFKGMMDYPL